MCRVANKQSDAYAGTDYITDLPALKSYDLVPPTSLLLLLLNLNLNQLRHNSLPINILHKRRNQTRLLGTLPRSQFLRSKNRLMNNCTSDSIRCNPLE